ncbi:MAG: DUF2442 domain-containing protein [bacterium]
MPQVIEVKALDNYKIWVKYSDGGEGEVDLSHLAGEGVFVLWDDYNEFKKVHIGPYGEIAWSEQIDLCPDAIYMKITGKKPEELFPKLQEFTVNAWNCCSF